MKNFVPEYIILGMRGKSFFAFLFSLLILITVTYTRPQFSQVLTLTVQEGLPSYYFYQLRMDSLGYIWALSPDGLYSYDGLSWDFAGISGQDLILEGITLNRFYFYQKKDFVFYSNKKSSHILLFEGHRKIAVKFSDKPVTIRNLVVDAQNQIWLLTSQNKLFRILENSPEDVQVSPIDQTREISYITYQNDRILLSHNNQIWSINPFTMEIDTLRTFQFPIKNFTFSSRLGFIWSIRQILHNEKVKIKQKLYLNRGERLTVLDSTAHQIRHMAIDSSKNLLLLEYNGRLIRYLTAQGYFENLTPYLNGKSAHDLLIYRDNSYWIPTENGITIIKNTPLQEIAFPEYISETNKGSVEKTFETSSGELFLFSKGGKVINLTVDYKKGYLFRAPFSTSSFKSGITFKDVLETDDGLLWILQTGELRVYDPVKNQIVAEYTAKDGLPPKASDLVLSPDGQILCFGAHAHTKQFQNKYGQTHPICSISLESIKPWPNILWPDTVQYLFLKKAIFDSKGNLYIYNSARPLLGIIYLSAENGSFQHIGLDSLRIIRVNDFFLTGEDEVLCATNRGLLILKNGRITKFLSGEDLFSTEIYDIFSDNLGNIWLLTGYALLEMNSEFQVQNIYGYREGFAANPVVYGSGLCDSKGRIWIGTSHGLFLFNPSESHFKPGPMPVFISSVKVNGVNQDWQNHPRGLKFPSSTQSVEISYKALNIFFPYDILYSTKLEGFDDDWSPLKTRTYESYTNLPPGNYRFRLKVLNYRSGEEVFLKTPLSFTIPEIFWKSRKFYLLLLLTAALISISILGFLRVENLRLEKKVKERTREMEAAKERYETIFHSSHNGLLLINQDLKVVEFNNRFLEIFKLSDRIKGQPLHKVFHSFKTNLNLAMLRERLEREDISSQPELLQFRFNGKNLIYTNLSYRKMFIEQNRPCYLLEFSDRSREYQAEEERREFEERLKRVDRLELISMTRAQITHDIKNHLQKIMGLAANQLTKFANGQQLSNQIIAICQDINELLSRFTGKGEKYCTNFQILNISNINTMLNQIASSSYSPDIQIRVFSNCPEVKIKSDLQGLNSVFSNLVRNSINAIDDRGNIELIVNLVEFTKERFLPNNIKIPPGQYVEIKLTDDGRGISKENLPRIFDPYITSDTNQGIGLGLYSVKKIIEEHRGYLTCESNIGVGTTFYIYLPIYQEVESPVSEDDETLQPPSGGNEKIIIIEDDPDFREWMKINLQELGYQIRDFPGGKEALEYIMEPESIPDLIITDLKMPGLNGWEVFTRIRQKYPEMPFLIISGYITNLVKAKILNEKLIGWLDKPFSEKALGYKVRSILNKKKIKII